MAKLVNLTPHDIVVRKADGDLMVPPSGLVARVTTSQEVVGDIDGVPIVRTIFGEVQGLPDPELDTVYIVSSLVLGALKGSRSDVVSPDTGPTAIRNEAGQIVAVTRFQVL